MPSRRTGPAPTQNGRKLCVRRAWVEPSVWASSPRAARFALIPSVSPASSSIVSSSPTMAPPSMCWGPICATARPSTTLSPTFRLRTATWMRPAAGSRVLRGKSSMLSFRERCKIWSRPQSSPLGRGPSPRSAPRGQQARAKPRLPLAYAGLDISFTVDGARLTVTAINDARD